MFCFAIYCFSSVWVLLMLVLGVCIWLLIALDFWLCCFILIEFGVFSVVLVSCWLFLLCACSCVRVSCFAVLLWIVVLGCFGCRWLFAACLVIDLVFDLCGGACVFIWCFTRADCFVS